MKQSPTKLSAGVFCAALLALVVSPLQAQTNPPKPPAAKSTASRGEIIVNGSFEEAEKGWRLEQIAPSVGDLSITDEGPKGTRCARVELLTAGDAHWKLSFMQKDLSVTEGKRYRISFWAKADQPRWVWVGFKQHQAPYKGLGSQNDIAIGTTWSQITLVIKPSASESNTRFEIGNLGQILGTIWFTNVSIIEE